MAFDAAEFMDLFVEDTDENLETLSRALLQLERDPADAEALGEAFRMAHSIKGASSMVGVEAIRAFTHRMEDLLQLLRDGSHPVTAETIDVLFACLDALKAMADGLRSGRGADCETAQAARVSAMLEALLAQSAPGGPDRGAGAQPPAGRDGEPLVLAAGQRERIETHRLHGNRIVEVRVRFAPSCPMATVRAFLIAANLGACGEVIATRPELDEQGAAEIGETFAALVATAQDDRALRRAADVDSVLDVSLADRTRAEQFDVPPAEETPPRTAFERREDRAASQTVRVGLAKLDRLLNLAGELVINRGRALALAAALPPSRELDELMGALLAEGELLTELQESVMASRMVPIDQLFQRFERVARDLSRELGKEVELRLSGRETELDKRIVDQLGDPLTHMVRNAIDHGIEPPAERVRAGKPRAGTLTLHASQEGDSIRIAVRDDGRGLDAGHIRARCRERALLPPAQLDALDDEGVLQLIFLPGFSTAARVTDLSGRGVGMDVVRRNVDALGGEVRLATQPGQGTTFTVRLPLTLAIIQALLVDVRGEVYAIPIAGVRETLRIAERDVFTVEGRGEVIRLREHVVPLVRLDEVFGYGGGALRRERPYVAVVAHEGRRVGLVVDRMVNEQEIVIRPLDGLARRAEGIAGATILGNGRVSLIVDVGTVVSQALVA